MGSDESRHGASVDGDIDRKEHHSFGQTSTLQSISMRLKKSVLGEKWPLSDSRQA